MPTTSEYEQAKEIIRDYVSQIGDEVLDEMQESSEDEEKLDIFRCRHGGNEFIIFGSPSREFFSVQFSYSLLSDIIRESIIDGSEVTDSPYLIGEEVKEETVQDSQNTVQDILGSMSDQEANLVRIKVVQLISDPSVAYDLSTPDGRRVDGFALTKKIFPYDESFKLSEFEESVQAVMFGVFGRLFLRSLYGIESGDYDVNLKIVEQI